MELRDAVDGYESWLANYMALTADDLTRKHQLMATAPFTFFRATYFRWSAQWPTLSRPEDQSAFPVLGVGDLHIENFGTWRDLEGRLIWGINDFDEATRLPFSQDLVRLAASAHLAIGAAHLTLRRRVATTAILDGYTEGLAAGGRPFVLEENHEWLRAIVTSRLRNPIAFWNKLTALPATTAPPAVRRLLAESLPRPGLRFRVAHRVAGLGSLGRPRYVALADWNGGCVAREAKALAPSAWNPGAADGSRHAHYAEVLATAIRIPDPSVRVTDAWIIRRLAPHCTRIELVDLFRERDESRLLFAMGFETANIHLGTPGARVAISRDLKRRPSDWLHQAAKPFAEAVTTDWLAWKSRGQRRRRPGPGTVVRR
ncbi:MAG TPA: DUF2252 family protein [Polyangia bacterium]